MMTSTQLYVSAAAAAAAAVFVGCHGDVDAR